MSSRFYWVVFVGLGLSLATAEVAQAQGAGRASGRSGASAGARGASARGGGIGSASSRSSARGAGPTSRPNGQARGNTGSSSRGIGQAGRGSSGRGSAGPSTRAGGIGSVRGSIPNRGGSDVRIINPSGGGNMDRSGIGSRNGNGSRIITPDRAGPGGRSGIGDRGGNGSRIITPERSGSGGRAGIGGGIGSRGGAGSGAGIGSSGGIGSRSGTGAAIGSPWRSGGPVTVPSRPGTGVAYGTRYPDRFNSDWMFDVRGRSYRARGPSYCRSGIGHPVFGRSWCASNHYGLGTRDLFWISVSWGRFSLQFGRVSRVRSWYGWHDFDHIQLQILLGPSMFGRIVSHGYGFGWHSPLAGVWFGDPYQGYHLRVYSGPYAVAELYDWDFDGWVDDIRLIQPY